MLGRFEDDFLGSLKDLDCVLRSLHCKIEKSKRDKTKAITKDDVTDLVITLNTTSVDEFIKSL